MDDYAKFLAQHGKTRWDYLKLQNEAEIFGVYDWPFDESLHIDHFVGSQAKGMIEQNELKEPFFMWVSFLFIITFYISIQGCNVFGDLELRR